MLSINPEILLIQFVTFAIGMGLIWVIYMKPLGRHLSERSKGIAKAIEDSQTAKSESEKLRAEVARELESLKAREKQVLDQARAEAQQMRDQIMAKARSEQEDLLAKARLQIQQETRLASQELRAETASLVIKATRKLLAQSLDAKAQEGLVEKFLKEIPQEVK